jgi:hypothetical protein
MTIRLVLQWLACLLSDGHQVVGAVADGRALIKESFHYNFYPSGKAERFFFCLPHNFHLCFRDDDPS